MGGSSSRVSLYKEEEEYELNYTALHYCVSQENAEAVEILLKNGANANIKDDALGQIPLFIAIHKDIQYRFQGNSTLERKQKLRFFQFFVICV